MKLILDTDIGTDVDDAWALAFCLGATEIDLLGVTLVHADLETRAKIALKMLRLAGREDVPVHRGLSETITPGGRLYWAGHEGSGTDFSDIDAARARDGAVDFIVRTVDANPGEVVLAPIGPLTNVAEAIRRAPETMRKLKRLAVMGATYNGDGSEVASPEHNIACDVAAARIVLESGIPATVVGLNVTMQVTVSRPDMPAIAVSPFGDYLAAMTNQYFGIRGRDETFMHDPLAIATVADPGVVTTRRMTAKVLDAGKVAFFTSPEGWLDVCTAVDAPRFGELLMANARAAASA